MTPRARAIVEEEVVKPADVKAAQRERDTAEKILHDLVTAIHGSQQVRAATTYATPDVQKFKTAFRAADNYFRN